MAVRFQTGGVRRAALAVLLAYALLVQALWAATGPMGGPAGMGGMGMGAGFDPAASLCLADPSAAPPAGHDGPGDAPDHGRFCCILGCGALASAAALPPATPSLPRPETGHGERVGLFHPAAPVWRGVLPVGARAPPMTA